ESERNADDGESARQNVPRAKTVDREARDSLGDAGDGVEDAAQNADIGEAETGTFPHDQQHRHEGELVVVADTVGNADQADHAQVATDGNGGGGHGPAL